MNLSEYDITRWRRLVFGGALVGVIIGLGLGLFISRVYWPVTYDQADPADLRLDIKDDYILMIAAAYSLDGNLARAMKRIQALQLAQPAATIADLARNETHLLARQALLRLSLDLNQPNVALARPTFTPRPTRVRRAFTPSATLFAKGIATAEPSATITPLASSITTPELAAPFPTSLPNPNLPRFALKSKEALTCAQVKGRPHIELQVQDAEGRPFPGIMIEANSQHGNEIFYTGLEPERGVGYADLVTTPGTFSIHLTGNAWSGLVTNLTIRDEPVECTSEATPIRGWKLVFQQVSK